MSTQLLNSPQNCVDEALSGLLAAQPSLALLRGHRVVVLRDLAAWRCHGRVALVCGGGSGHEPSHAGFVGAGMLTGAVAGDVFASPPTSSVLAALDTVDSSAGVLLILKNYTGDRLNFGLAAERRRAAGGRVEMVVVGEDTALTGKDRTAGRRGLAGALFVNKIAGAVAEEGRPLAEVAAIARQVAGQIGTISVSLSACTKPGQGKSFELPVGQMELGLGIHGEAGVKRMKALSSHETVAAMLDHMTGSGEATSGTVSPTKFSPAPRVALLVNNLGGLSTLELLVVTNDVIKQLRQRGVSVVRVVTGTLMTSMEMAGVSVSLLNLSSEAGNASEQQLLTWLDAPTTAPCWPRTSCPDLFPDVDVVPVVTTSSEVGDADSEEAVLDSSCARRLSRCLEFASEALVSCAAQINALDTGAGDGDCGSTLAAAGKAVLAAYLPAKKPRVVLKQLGSLCETVGGTSGALYSIAFTAAAAGFPTSPSSSVDSACWVEALRNALEAVQLYGRAQPGDRTLLDAAAPALQAAEAALKEGKPGAEVAQAAAEAAETGALATATMMAHAGRASYVSAEMLTRPDPGAHAVGVWMRAVAEALKLGQPTEVPKPGQ